MTRSGYICQSLFTAKTTKCLDVMSLNITEQTFQIHVYTCKLKELLNAAGDKRVADFHYRFGKEKKRKKNMMYCQYIGM